MTGKFVILRRWWRGQVVIRFGPSSEVYDLWIKSGGSELHFVATANPFETTALAFLSEKQEKWIDERGREIDPFAVGKTPARLRPNSDGNPTKETPCFVELIADGAIETLEDSASVKRFAVHIGPDSKVLNLVRESASSGFWQAETSKQTGPAASQSQKKAMLPLSVFWKAVNASPVVIEVWPGLTSSLLGRPLARTEILNFGLQGTRWFGENLIEIVKAAAQKYAGRAQPQWLVDSVRRLNLAHVTDLHPQQLIKVARELDAVCIFDLALSAPQLMGWFNSGLMPSDLRGNRLIILAKQRDGRLASQLSEYAVALHDKIPCWMYTNFVKVDQTKTVGELIKADDEQQIIFGIVLKPDVPDSQGDIFSPEEVERAAHSYLIKSRLFDWRHQRTLPPDQVMPVESYIAPTDFEVNGKRVPKGSWVMAAHVADKGIWSQIKSGAIRAYSIRGFGIRKPIRDGEKDVTPVQSR